MKNKLEDLLAHHDKNDFKNEKVNKKRHFLNRRSFMFHAEYYDLIKLEENDSEGFTAKIVKYGFQKEINKN